MKSENDRIPEPYEPTRMEKSQFVDANLAHWLPYNKKFASHAKVNGFFWFP